MNQFRYWPRATDAGAHVVRRLRGMVQGRAVKGLMSRTPRGGLAVGLWNSEGQTLFIHAVRPASKQKAKEGAVPAGSQSCNPKCCWITDHTSDVNKPRAHVSSTASTPAPTAATPKARAKLSRGPAPARPTPKARSKAKSNAVPDPAATQMDDEKAAMLQRQAELLGATTE